MNNYIAIYYFDVHNYTIYNIYTIYVFNKLKRVLIFKSKCENGDESNILVDEQFGGYYKVILA